MSEQRIELLLVKIELLSKRLMHCITSNNNTHKEVVCTMHHNVILKPCKICDWLLNSSWIHFGLHQGKNCQSDHEVRGPQKTKFKARISH
jgi:hypothetical protein